MMANVLLFLFLGVSTLVVIVNSLQARNCYPYEPLPIYLNSLTLSPSEIRIPGVTRVHFDCDVGVDVGTPETPLAARVTMQRVITLGWGWFTYTHHLDVPCLDAGDGLQVGSCDYEDVCAIVARINNQTNNAQCAEAQRYGFPCSCPVPAATYTTGRRPIIADLTQGIDQIPSSLSILLEGDYITRVELRSTLDNNDNANLLGCLDLEYEITMD